MLENAIKNIVNNPLLTPTLLLETPKTSIIQFSLQIHDAEEVINLISRNCTITIAHFVSHIPSKSLLKLLMSRGIKVKLHHVSTLYKVEPTFIKEYRGVGNE